MAEFDLAAFDRVQRVERSEEYNLVLVKILNQKVQRDGVQLTITVPKISAVL